MLARMGARSLCGFPLGAVLLAITFQCRGGLLIEVCSADVGEPVIVGAQVSLESPARAGVGRATRFGGRIRSGCWRCPLVDPVWRHQEGAAEPMGAGGFTFLGSERISTKVVDGSDGPSVPEPPSPSLRAVCPAAYCGAFIMRSVRWWSPQ